MNDCALLQPVEGDEAAVVDDRADTVEFVTLLFELGSLVLMYSFSWPPSHVFWKSVSLCLLLASLSASSLTALT